MNNQIEIDTGKTLITLKADSIKTGTVFTVYATGISIRSQLLHLPRVYDSFVASVYTALDLDVDSDECTPTIADQIGTFVDDVLN